MAENTDAQVTTKQNGNAEMSADDVLHELEPRLSPTDIAELLDENSSFNRKTVATVRGYADILDQKDKALTVESQWLKQYDLDNKGKRNLELSPLTTTLNIFAYGDLAGNKNAVQIYSALYQLGTKLQSRATGKIIRVDIPGSFYHLQENISDANLSRNIEAYCKAVPKMYPGDLNTEEYYLTVGATLFMCIPQNELSDSFAKIIQFSTEIDSMNIPQSDFYEEHKERIASIDSIMEVGLYVRRELSKWILEANIPGDTTETVEQYLCRNVQSVHPTLASEPAWPILRHALLEFIMMKRKRRIDASSALTEMTVDHLKTASDQKLALYAKKLPKNWTSRYPNGQRAAIHLLCDSIAEKLRKDKHLPFVKDVGVDYSELDKSISEHIYHEFSKSFPLPTELEEFFISVKEARQSNSTLDIVVTHVQDMYANYRSDPSNRTE
jgi:hypothetical protein